MRRVPPVSQCIRRPRNDTPHSRHGVLPLAATLAFIPATYNTDQMPFIRESEAVPGYHEERIPTAFAYQAKPRTGPLVNNSETRRELQPPWGTTNTAQNIVDKIIHSCLVCYEMLHTILHTKQGRFSNHPLSPRRNISCGLFGGFPNIMMYQWALRGLVWHFVRIETNREAITDPVSLANFVIHKQLPPI